MFLDTWSNASTTYVSDERCISLASLTQARKDFIKRNNIGTRCRWQQGARINGVSRRHWLIKRFIYPIERQKSSRNLTLFITQRGHCTHSTKPRLNTHSGSPKRFPWMRRAFASENENYFRAIRHVRFRALKESFRQSAFYRRDRDRFIIWMFKQIYVSSILIASE